MESNYRPLEAAAFFRAWPTSAAPQVSPVANAVIMLSMYPVCPKPYLTIKKAVTEEIINAVQKVLKRFILVSKATKTTY